jgi:acyl homoserine lactone synthase
MNTPPEELMEADRMFTLVYGDDLFDFPQLANEMFHDRRAQFKEALGWSLKVDALGREIDEYDLQNPLYIILRDAEGRHLGSTRLLPTTGRTMIADRFSDLTHGVEIESPLIWETTRFFIARRDGDSRKNAAALMWAGCQIGLRAGVQFYVGVTAAHMVRVFAACGWPCEVIGRRTDSDGEICACLWEVDEAMCDRLRHRAGIDASQHTLRVHRRPVGRPAVPIQAFVPFAGAAEGGVALNAA